MRRDLSTTIEFIDQAIDTISLRDPDWPAYRWDRRTSARIVAVDGARAAILNLEEKARELTRDRGGEQPLSDKVDPRFPVYSEVIDVVPIYRDAVSLERRRPTVRPSEIPSLLYLLGIPGHADGLDLENHGFGYHFHYGRIKSSTLVRTNLLFTFDPKVKVPVKMMPNRPFQPSLYSEYHAGGKTKSIDAEAIGENRRNPIYLVCLDAGEKRGLANFKHPSKDAVIFYSGRALSSRGDS